MGEEKIALLIGIDEYQEVAWKGLQGCKNDVRMLQHLLIDRFGFPDDNVRLLLDAEATQRGIREAMAELASRVRPDSIVLFFFAGHGSQLADRDDSNPTGWEQTLVPHDSGRSPVNNRDIADAEIRAWVCAIERVTPYVTLIFDCCHSGTMTRGDDLEMGAGVRGVPARQRAAEAPLQGAAVAAGLGRLARSRLALDIMPRPDRYVVLSACRDEELASELSTRESGSLKNHGAFSYYLCKALAQETELRSYRDLFEVAAARVTDRFPRQHPRSEGALDRSIFGTRAVAARPFVSVLAVSEAEVTLRGGALHGLTVGSEWEVSAVADSADAAAARALVRVHSVSAGLAYATILSTKGPLKLPCRAVERQRADALYQWPVAVAPDPELHGLLPLLSHSPWLRPAAEGEPVRASIVRVPQGAAARETGTPAGLRPAARYALSVLGREKDPLLPLLPEESGADTHALLVEEVERLVRCSWLRSLNNPRSALGAAVEAKLLLGPSWRPGPIDGAGRVLAQDGSLVAIELRNVSEQPVHVAAIIVGADRSITQIYPPPGAPSQRIEPGRRTRVGTWQLCIPSASVLPPRALQHAASSVDTLKLFVTPQEIDLYPVLQGSSVRGAGADHPLQSRLNTVLAGVRTRSGDGEIDGELSDWACIGLDVLITATPR